jgi:tol-pal system protein YbgF
LGTVLCFGIARTASADEVDDLRAQVDQLKSQVTLLQNQMPGASSGGVSSGGTVAAQQEVRLQQLSAQISQLQGEIEQVGIKVDDLTDKFSKFQKDTEYRLGTLEQGGAAGAGTGAAAGTAPLGGNPVGGNAGGNVATPMATTGAPATVMNQSQSVPSVGGAGQPQTLVGPEGAPPPTQPGILGTLPPGAAIPQAPAGAAEAAAAAAGQQSPSAAQSQATQDPKSIVLPGNNPQEQYDYATGLLQRGAYAEAEIALKAFVAQHPNDALTGNAQYWLGETYYARSDFKNAAVAFAEGYQKYPKSPKAPDNLLKLGMTLGQIGQKDNACTAFKQLAKQYPTASSSIKDRAARAQQRYGCSG